MVSYWMETDAQKTLIVTLEDATLLGCVKAWTKINFAHQLSNVEPDSDVTLGHAWLLQQSEPHVLLTMTAQLGTSVKQAPTHAKQPTSLTMSRVT
jgi:hypothetical protein